MLEQATAGKILQPVVRTMLLVQRVSATVLQQVTAHRLYPETLARALRQEAKLLRHRPTQWRRRANC